MEGKGFDFRDLRMESMEGNIWQDCLSQGQSIKSRRCLAPPPPPPLPLVCIMPSIRTITRVCLGTKRCVHWTNPVPWSASVIDRAKIREAFKRGNAICESAGISGPVYAYVCIISDIRERVRLSFDN